MSSILCFICHSTVNCDTQEEMREKYKEVVGMNLCPDSHLCYICCHVLNKLYMFRSMCLKRSMEYPMLFSEKVIINLQRNDIEFHTLCSDEPCQGVNSINTYQINYEICSNDTNAYNGQEYIKLEEELEKTNTDNASVNIDTDLYKEYDDGTEMKDDDVTKEDICDATQYIDDCNYVNDEDIDRSTYNEHVQDNEVEPEMPNEETYNSNQKLNGKVKKTKKRGFVKIVLSVEQQKGELEANRKGKKYLDSEFKCYNCALGFLFKDTYQTHMMRHEESNGEYRCELCTLRFATPAVLRSHVSLHAERYRCGRCEALLRPRARAKHAAACSRRGTSDYVACHLCANLFKDASGLQQHLRRVHNTKSGRVYPCSVCGEACRNQAAVRTHMLKHLKKKFACNECPAVYSSPYTLNQHKKTHQMGQERHFCTTCGVSYTTRKSLMAHRRNSLNHQQTVFECSKCIRVFPHRRALEAHENKFHAQAKPPAPSSTRTRKPPIEQVICYLCGKSFKGNSKLNRHLREVCEKMKLNEQTESVYE
ncbi:zinc finger protein 660-like [Battus philenor]|uniref:zinc finger protein 660-like n=1 Tax=Battus philenor TaxID=42288 RepID=UPI0035CEE899